MRCRKLAAAILCVFLLTGMAACAATPAENITPETVVNLFTQPVTEPLETVDRSDLSIPSTGFFGIVPCMETKTESERTYFPYSGGEFHYPFQIINQGNSYGEFGLGFLLFVDGVPQPYRMSENQEPSYMQIIYPGQASETEPLEYEFIFTPVAGSEGEFVEFSVAIVQYPWYYEEASRNIQNTTCMGISHVTLYFEQTPPGQDLPKLSDRLESYSVSYEDLTAADIGSYSSAELNSILDWNFSADGKAQGIHFNITENDEINIHYELFGCKEMEYSVIFFVDNQPVYVDPTQTHVDVHSGEKTLIDLQISQDSFDGRTLVYAVIICGNYWELLSQGKPFSGPSIMASFSVYYVSEECP